MQIFPERCTKEIPKSIIPKTPNSIPLNGNTPKKPPIPKIPANPKAQEEQAGVRTLAMMPDKPIPAPYELCLFTKKRLKEKIMPDNTEMITNNAKETAEMVRWVLMMRSKIRSKENCDKINLKLPISAFNENTSRLNNPL